MKNTVGRVRAIPPGAAGPANARALDCESSSFFRTVSEVDGPVVAVGHRPNTVHKQYAELSEEELVQVFASKGLMTDDY